MVKLDKGILPTNDLVFRKIFTSKGNEDILAGLLRDFFGLDVKTEEVIVTDPYDIRAYKIDGEEVLRETVHDVTATVNDLKFIMEMQVSKDKFFRERSVLYLANAYSQGYGRLPKSSSHYESLRPVYSLNILGYREFEDAEAIRSEDLCELCYHMFLELSKEFTGTEVQKHWYIFLNTGFAEPDAPEYIKKAARFFEEMKKGKNICDKEVEVMNTSQRLQEKFDYMKSVGRDEGRVEGLAEGLAEGITEGQLRVASNMQKLGMSVDEIAKMIDMPVYELERMLRERKPADKLSENLEDVPEYDSGKV